MSELPDEPPLPRRRTPRGRRPRFVMPTEHHDERVGEVIEAFLDGPPLRARMAPRPLRRRSALRAMRQPIPLDTRLDWDVALRHEDARMRRYARPASVLVIRIDVPRSEVAEYMAGRVGDIVREHARETDRVTRAATDRYHVLLPETDEVQADVMADRIRDACKDRMAGLNGSEPEVLVAPASPADGETLHDALRSAQVAVGA
jgi:hypothetical protein